MHSSKSKFLALLALVIVVAAVLGVAYSGLQIKPEEKAEDIEEKQITELTNDKETIILWYTDEALTDYLNSAAVGYSEKNDQVRVLPELVSGMEYLESISNASVENEHFPDIYITTNDTLEKAHLAGLADTISEENSKELGYYFPQVSINAATFDNEIIGYPFYYECAVFLYNKTYIDDWAKTTAEAEIDTEEGEKAQAEADNADKSTLKAAEEIKTDTLNSDSSNSSESNEVVADEVVEDPEHVERVEKRSAELIEENFPTSIDKLLAFSDMYDAPEQVEGIFKWDVTDILYNYFFIGDSIDVGGSFGDDVNTINIYNENAIRGLNTYQDLNRFFSISTDEISYEGVMQDFIDGKILFTVATTDSVKMLKDAKENGEMDFEFGYAKLPDIMEGTDAKSMSVTDVIAINGYSVHKDEANAFAKYLSEMDGNALYERTGKVSALSSADYADDNAYFSVFMAEYVESAPLPKMLETSNMWVQLEMLFASVWDGADANAGLKALSEQMKLQITGEKVSEELIVIEAEPEEVEDEIEETDTLEE